MGINTFLSTVILVAFVVTLVLAVGSYFAYKMRENRRPSTAAHAPGDGPVFFERFYPAVTPKRDTPESVGVTARGSASSAVPDARE